MLISALARKRPLHVPVTAAWYWSIKSPTVGTRLPQWHQRFCGHAPCDRDFGKAASNCGTRHGLTMPANSKGTRYWTTCFSSRPWAQDLRPLRKPTAALCQHCIGRQWVSACKEQLLHDWHIFIQSGKMQWHLTVPILCMHISFLKLSLMAKKNFVQHRSLERLGSRSLERLYTTAAWASKGLTRTTGREGHRTRGPQDQGYGSDFGETYFWWENVIFLRKRNFQLSVITLWSANGLMPRN